jgi:hypothetical protein
MTTPSGVSLILGLKIPEEPWSSPYTSGNGGRPVQIRDIEGLVVFEHAAGKVPGARAVPGGALESDHRVVRQRHRLMTRVSPVMPNFAVDLMSLELLPALTSTGPGSMTKSPESRRVPEHT